MKLIITMCIIILFSLAINVYLGLTLLNRGVKSKFAGKLKTETGPRIYEVDNTMKEIIDRCLPKDSPSMSELEETN